MGRKKKEEKKDDEELEEFKEDSEGGFYVGGTDTPDVLDQTNVGPGIISQSTSDQYEKLINTILASPDSKQEILRLVSMSDLSTEMVIRVTSLLTINDYLRERYGKVSEILTSFIVNICASSIGKQRLGRREVVSIMGGAEISPQPEMKKKKSWWNKMFT